jgi:hypothetical protein
MYEANKKTEKEKEENKIKMEKGRGKRIPAQNRSQPQPSKQNRSGIFVSSFASLTCGPYSSGHVSRLPPPAEITPEPPLLPPLHFSLLPE